MAAEQAALVYLRRPQAIRERAGQLFEQCQANRLEHFVYDPAQLEAVAAYVVETTRQLYPDFEVPFHSRWRHFDGGGVPRLAALNQALAERGDLAEQVRSRLDLAIVSVLLDAGAGSRWRYRDGDTVLGRSEGLAIASLRAFEQGVFGAPYRVTAQGLQNLTEAALAQAFQVTDENPLVGLSGRLTLLQRLGQTLAAQPERFGRTPARPGHLLDYLEQQYGGTLGADTLLTEVLIGLGPIWPGRLTLAGENLGDVWPHPALQGDGPGENLMPFHKLSQWLTYSLVEPLVAGGIEIQDLNALTGLAEYRNGGLFVDLGLLVPKHAAVTQQAHTPGSALVVEWRALTVVLLDLVGERVRQQLGQSAEELPLIKVLEGGTWAAGRRIAKQKRADGTPPIAIRSDGTVF